MAIGKKLEELLKAKKIKPGTLANQIGVNKNTLYGILKRDNKSVNFSTIEKIAAALDVPVEYFFSSASEANEQQQDLAVDDNAEEEKEQEMIKKYRALDGHGREVVDVILSLEYKRLMK